MKSFDVKAFVSGEVCETYHWCKVCSDEPTESSSNITITVYQNDGNNRITEKIYSGTRYNFTEDKLIEIYGQDGRDYTVVFIDIDTMDFINIESVLQPDDSSDVEYIEVAEAHIRLRKNNVVHLQNVSNIMYGDHLVYLINYNPINSDTVVRQTLVIPSKNVDCITLNGSKIHLIKQAGVDEVR